MDEQDADIPDNVDHDAPDSPESKLLGGPVQKNTDKSRLASPLTYVSAADPPFLILHGDRDPIVAYGQSLLLEEALRKAGVRVTLHTVKGGGHNDGFGEPEYRAAEAFTREILRK